MDRNSITGLLLIFLILSIYFQFFAPTPEPGSQDGLSSDSTQEVIESEKEVDPIQNTQKVVLDSNERKAAFGELATLSEGKPRIFTLENEVMKISFNTQGGKVERVELKKYQTFDQKPVVLLDKENSRMNLEVKTAQGKNLDLYSLYFESPQEDQKLSKGDRQKIRFRAKISDKKFIEQVYTLSGDGYLVDYDLRFVGMDDIIPNRNVAQFHWLDKMRKFELDLYYARYYATVNYSNQEGDYNYLSWPSEAEESESFKNENLHWFSFKQRFFNAGLIAKNRNLQNVKITSNTPLSDSSTVKITEAYADWDITSLNQNKKDFQFYFGPNDYNLLAKLEIENYKNNVHLGWALFAMVSRYIVIPLFTNLELVFTNYGIIIIFIVLIIKTCLLPLTYKSYYSMAKMRVMNEYLKPELDKFKKENGIEGGNSMMSMSSEHQQLVQKKQMELYAELGSSPFAAMSGCIPLLLQMPILLALFLFFPNAIELRQESFLWATDLSTYDSILNLPFRIPGYGAHVSLFTLLMTLSTIALTFFNNQNQSNIQGPMKYMGYFMPVIFMFVLNSYPAGLSFYYLVQNLVTIGQQGMIKKFFIDEDKIKARFDEYKIKNKGKEKKKSSLQMRLEDAQRKQQEKAEARKKQKENNKGNRRK